MKPYQCSPPLGCDNVNPQDQIEYVYSVQIFRNGEHVYTLENVKGRALEEGLDVTTGKPGLKLRSGPA